jgi:hypothetical protein
MSALAADDGRLVSTFHYWSRYQQEYSKKIGASRTVALSGAIGAAGCESRYNTGHRHNGQ